MDTLRRRENRGERPAYAVCSADVWPTARTEAGRGNVLVLQGAALYCLLPALVDESEMSNDIPAATRRLVWERQDGQCARCGNRGTDIHHRIRRRDGGHGIANLVGLCRTCHSWVHAHPKQAQDSGYIVGPYVEDVAVALIKTFMGWAQFTHEGKVVLV